MFGLILKSAFLNRLLQTVVSPMSPIECGELQEERLCLGPLNPNTLLGLILDPRTKTGIPICRKNDGKFERAQQIACRESARTTDLYDRRNETMTLEEVERIVYGTGRLPDRRIPMFFSSSASRFLRR
jgi:hypothetical protein